MADTPETLAEQDSGPISVVVHWTVSLQGKRAKKAMKPGKLQPDFREAALRGLEALRVDPRCGRPMSGGDHRWIWDDKATVPDFRIVYEIDIEEATVIVRYIGDRGSVPY